MAMNLRFQNDQRARVVIEISSTLTSIQCEEIGFPQSTLFFCHDSGDEFYLDLNGSRHVITYRTEPLPAPELPPPYTGGSENEEVR